MYKMNISFGLDATCRAWAQSTPDRIDSAETLFIET
jgi:hypothetical protein